MTAFELQDQVWFLPSGVLVAALLLRAVVREYRR